MTLQSLFSSSLQHLQNEIELEVTLITLCTANKPAAIKIKKPLLLEFCLTNGLRDCWDLW